jgi:hypothetical protein
MSEFAFPEIETPPYFDAFKKVEATWKTVIDAMGMLASANGIGNHTTLVNYRIGKHTSAAADFLDAFVSPGKEMEFPDLGQVFAITPLDVMEGYKGLVSVYGSGLKDFAEQHQCDAAVILRSRLDDIGEIPEDRMTNLFPRDRLLSAYTNHYAQQVPKHVQLVLEQL